MVGSESALLAPSFRVGVACSIKCERRERKVRERERVSNGIKQDHQVRKTLPEH